MILSKPKSEFLYRGEIYRVGDTVIANGESIYAGLVGTICEIRTGEYKETDNETPEIFCHFDPPVMQRDISELEKRFSEACMTEKKIEDIPLDCVIMSPEMLICPDSTENKERVYVLTEEWANDGNSGVNTTVFTDMLTAKAFMNLTLSNEMTNGLISKWKDNGNFRFEEEGLSYEGWIDGYYTELHSSISIEEREITVTPDFIRKMGERHIKIDLSEVANKLLREYL